MATFFDKVTSLKKQFMYSGDTDALVQVAQWEDKFARLQVQKEWVIHPNTIELKNLVAEQIKNIVSTLANKEDLTQEDRLRLFAEKKCHLLYLALLSDDPSSEMEMLEQKTNSL